MPTEQLPIKQQTMTPSPTPVIQKQKLDVHDIVEEDKKIPRALIMSYQGKPFVLKAGLEWKANLLFKGGNWGISLDIVEKTPDYVLAKATFTTKDGMVFTNFGEASKANVSNTMMHKYLVHLALTRAECRVLRMATASAYVSAEEMDWYSEGKNAEKELPVGEKDGEPVTTAQIDVIQKLGGQVKEGMTQGEAKQLIASLAKK